MLKWMLYLNDLPYLGSLIFSVEDIYFYLTVKIGLASLA